MEAVITLWWEDNKGGSNMWRKIRRFWWGLRALLARWGIALPGKVMYIGGSDTLPPL